MQFELHPRDVMTPHFLDPRLLMPRRKSVQRLFTLRTIPMVLARHHKHRVAERELRLRQIAPHEVSLFGRQLPLSEQFFREQETRAAVEQKPRGFRQRNPDRVSMMFAPMKNRFIAEQHAMSRNQIITE